MPDLNDLERSYRSDGLVVLGISREDATTQLNFSKMNNVSYPLLVDNNGLTKPYSEIERLPTTFIINRNGIIRDVLVGYRPEILEDAVVKVLQDR